MGFELVVLHTILYERDSVRKQFGIIGRVLACVCYVFFVNVFSFLFFFFFFSSRRRHTRWNCDWSSDVCSSDLIVAAAAEERFDRQKHSPRFPSRSIQYCLARAGLSIDDVDEIAHSFDYAPYRKLFSLDPVSERLYREVYSKDALLARVHREFPQFPSERVHQVNHHLAHAASACYTSGWDNCLVVVADGMGEAHGVSIYRGSSSGLELLAEMSALDSIGILYSLVTLHLGFDFNCDEYKIMGLAPYGDARRFRRF